MRNELMLRHPITRTLTHSHAEYVEGKTLVDMTREDLIAERIRIEFS